jgi:hypothetical protein
VWVISWQRFIWRLKLKVCSAKRQSALKAIDYAACANSSDYSLVNLRLSSSVAAAPYTRTLAGLIVRDVLTARLQTRLRTSHWIETIGPEHHAASRNRPGPIVQIALDCADFIEKVGSPGCPQR